MMHASASRTSRALNMAVPSYKIKLALAKVP